MRILDRLRTGVSGLDKLFRGGLPKGSLVLVLGPPGSGKTILGLQFLLEGILYGKTCILVDTVDSVPMMKETALGFGWDPGLLEGVIRLDCFSWRTGARSALPYSANPANFSDLSIAVSKLIDERGIGVPSNERLVFDSFSDIILHSSEFLKFSAILHGKLSKAGITSLLMVEEGMHDEKTISAIEHESDGTIVLKADEIGRFIMVRRMLATPTAIKWIPFHISQGIEVKAEIFFS